MGVARRNYTVVSQFFPCSVDTSDAGLATQQSFGADFTSHSGDFTSKYLQLIHHSIDVTASNGGNDFANLSQRFLESLVGLLVLPKLTLQSGDTLLLKDLKGSLLELLLLHELGIYTSELLALTIEQLGLVVHVVSKSFEGFFGQLISRHMRRVQTTLGGKDFGLGAGRYRKSLFAEKGVNNLVGCIWKWRGS
ncbi:hypothetical protein HG530_007256 [Fusarium avenaceum]|nr:hypothetical protein HG530_007256 [Fusarium avenaceum]